MNYEAEVGCNIDGNLFYSFPYMYIIYKILCICIIVNCVL